MTGAREWAMTQSTPAETPRARAPVVPSAAGSQFALRPKNSPPPPPRRGPQLPKPGPGFLQQTGVVDLTATSQGDTPSFGARARIQTRTRTRASTRAHAGTHTHTHRYTHAHARTRTRAHLHARRNTHGHPDTQAHTHTHKHTHARLLIRPWARGARRSRPPASSQRTATGRTGSAPMARTRGICGCRQNTSPS